MWHIKKDENIFQADLKIKKDHTVFTGLNRASILMKATKGIWEKRDSMEANVIHEMLKEMKEEAEN